MQLLPPQLLLPRVRRLLKPLLDSLLLGSILLAAAALAAGVVAAKLGAVLVTRTEQLLTTLFGMLLTLEMYTPWIVGVTQE